MVENDEDESALMKDRGIVNAEWRLSRDRIGSNQSYWRYHSLRSVRLAILDLAHEQSPVSEVKLSRVENDIIVRTIPINSLAEAGQIIKKCQQWEIFS